MVSTSACQAGGRGSIPGPGCLFGIYITKNNEHFHSDAVVPSSDHCTETVLPSSDYHCIVSVAPSGDHCLTETVESSTDH